MKLAYLEVLEREPVPVVRIDGEIDMSNVEEVRNDLLEAVGVAPALVLDLSGVAYLDSAGVQLLFDLERRLVANAARLVLVVPDDSTLSRILDVARVDAAVRVERDVMSALRSFQGSNP